MPPTAVVVKADHLDHLRRAAEAAADEEEEASRAIYNPPSNSFDSDAILSSSTGQQRPSISGGFSLRDLLDNQVHGLAASMTAATEAAAAAARDGGGDQSADGGDSMFAANDAISGDEIFNAVLFEDKRIPTGGDNAELQEHTEWLHLDLNRDAAKGRLHAAGLPESGFVLRSIAGVDRYVISIVVEAEILHHLIARVEGGLTFQLNGAGPGIGLSVDAAVRNVLALDGIDVLCPIYPR